jgi:oxygen-dependent protoporphyrinogen oxidase
MNRHDSHRVAVLGAGITGLTAAWHLKHAGLSPVVFEKSSRVGGAIGEVRSGDWLHELGPNSLLEGSASLTQFIDDLGLGSRRLYASLAAKQRYIVRDGQLVAMPTSPLGFVTTPLFSLSAKLRLLGEPWRAPAPVQIEESVSEFVVRRLGREFLDYAINPFVGGVYAGDPAALSVRHAFPKLHALEQEHGSLIRGALKRRNTTGGPKGRIFSFPNGLSELPRAIADGLGEAIRLRSTITEIRRTEDGWTARGERDGIAFTEEFAAVVSALPADGLAGLSISGTPDALHVGMLRQIEHPPVASVFTGFRREDIPHPLDGFGVLMPEIEQSQILGTLFSSTLFPGRAPEGHAALTTFVGGTRQPELVGLSDDALLAVVQRELARLLGVRTSPTFARVQRWSRAIPQYTLGYERFKTAIDRVESSAPGLFIGGNCRDGISLANCIASGQRIAEAANQFVQHRAAQRQQPVAAER